MTSLPQVLSARQRDEVITHHLRQRLDTILPLAMREAGLDMWLIICQEDDLDPVFKSMIPMNTWTPILQMLIFYDRGEDGGIERINLSATDTHDLYERPWTGRRFPEQWEILAQIVEKRDPQRIGLNIGETIWAGGGLTYNLHQQILRHLPERYHERLVSAEAACTRWLMTLSETQLQVYPHVLSISRHIIANCYSRACVTPGVTTTDDLEWAYWQQCLDLGFEQAFKPYFRIIRSQADQAIYPLQDKVIRPGDLLHCDVGLRYLRLITDHQIVAYVRRNGEQDAPAGLRNLLVETNRLQQIYLNEFQVGLTGNELLANILSSTRKQGIKSPRIYSHSVGLCLHEPGPLIGLPWEQERCPGRGDVRLQYNTCYTMELSIEDTVPEWGDQSVLLSTEHVVKFTETGCEPMGPVQCTYHLI